MVPPTGDGGSPAPIDRQILEYLQNRLETTGQVSEATITDAEGHGPLANWIPPNYANEDFERFETD